jgi:hypothetical protein
MPETKRKNLTAWKQQVRSFGKIIQNGLRPGGLYQEMTQWLNILGKRKKSAGFLVG